MTQTCTRLSNAIEPAGTADHRAALLAGYLGWTLNAFDFSPGGFLPHRHRARVPQVRRRDGAHPDRDARPSPVGAFFFGLLADRYGRRLPLMIDLVFYSIIEVLSGLAPNYTTFLILRALFGVGTGGERGVGTSLAMEKVPVRLRGGTGGDGTPAARA